MVPEESRIMGRPTYEELQEKIALLEQEILRRAEVEAALRAERGAFERRIEERTAALIAANARLQREVDERASAEKALRESVQHYRTVFETTGTATVIIEPDTTISMANSEFERMSGFTKEEIEGKLKWTVFVVPEDLERMREYHIKRRAAVKGVPTDYEFRFLDRWGVVKDVYNRVALIGDTGRSVSSITDITALRQAETLFRDIFDNAEVGLFIVQDRKFSLVNPIFARMTGYSAEELTAMDSMSLITPDERESTAKEVVAMLKSKRFTPYELRVRDRAGRERFVMVSLGSISYKGKPALLGNFMDITEKKAMEEELLRSEKLESLGLLAGGIAHDFNNLLTVILGNIDLARLELPRQSAGHINLIEAEKACLSAKELTQQFITFSKGGAPIRARGSLPETIAAVSRVALMGSGVTVSFNFSQDLWPLLYDESQIRHALKNILVNAKEAMKDKGAIKLTVENMEVGDGEVPHPAFRMKPGPYIRIMVEDTGPGIPKENLPRLFDPYFSTKERGAKRGMGLGLTTAYNIIKRHDGYIHVESPEGAGARVILYLPALPSESVHSGFQMPSEAHPSVLVMDDEEHIRLLSREILERLGCSAVLARDGSEAVSIYKEALRQGRRFDFVILDLTVKDGMGGEEAFKTLLEIDPMVRAVVTSGYGNDPALMDFESRGFSGSLPKPYSLDDLKKVIHRLIPGLTQQHSKA
jgi:PAS domain S-box-containing protein